MTNEKQDGLQTDHRNARSRLVVTGVGADGRSTIVSDALSDKRFVGDAYCVNMMWQARSIPVSIEAESSITEVNFRPPPNGVTVVTTTFPPDSSYDYKAGYAKSLEDWGANHRTGRDNNPAMHTTDSIDIVTIVNGEIWAILEGAETLMKAGDVLVQRGTRHAWENRSNRDCTIVATLLSATR
ncbi:hypothetical protein ASE04_18085 [Rhizobium sp. Root708]|uniref:cupin domain-containing protein n=1 Tax=Rhizobium sp. Root708 TaxID=1736592 RepID=UPI0006FAFC29|nr:cupin domain-containing protein [Rhizobium sp. Root708]KRB49097.1 hypothetical protein ASE04_18085 [Rhizobium sp. Root708]